MQPPGWFCKKRRLSLEFSKLNPADRKRPGFTNDQQSAQVRQAAERSGLNPDDCRFESCAGHLKTIRLGRQLADHLGLEPGMLWVRIPPEPLTKQQVLVEQPGVLACLSRRRSWVQIPSGTLGTTTARYANRQSGQPQTLVIVCGFNSHPCHWNENASAGHWRAQVAVTHPPPALQVQLLPDALKNMDTTARCDAGLAARLSISPTRVRFPSASLIRLGVMLVLQSGPQPDRRGFDSRPSH